MIDETDRKILKNLQENGQLTNAQLSERVHLSPSACHRRIKNLEEKGIIFKYVAIISARKLGYKTSVFVQVTLDNQRRETLEKFEQHVLNVDEVMECHLMGGQADYIMRVLVEGPQEYESLHQNVLTRLPGVSRIISNFAIRSVVRRHSLKLP